MRREYRVASTDSLADGGYPQSGGFPQQGYPQQGGGYPGGQQSGGQGAPQGYPQSYGQPGGQQPSGGCASDEHEVQLTSMRRRLLSGVGLSLKDPFPRSLIVRLPSVLRIPHVALRTAFVVRLSLPRKTDVPPLGCCNSERVRATDDAEDRAAAYTGR